MESKIFLIRTNKQNRLCMTEQVRSETEFGLIVFWMKISAWESTSHSWIYYTRHTLDMPLNLPASLSCSVKEKEG